MSRLRVSALLNHSSGSKANARIIPLTFLTFIELFPFLTTLLRGKFGQPEEDPGVCCGTGPGHPGVFALRSLLSPPRNTGGRGGSESAAAFVQPGGKELPAMPCSGLSNTTIAHNKIQMRWKEPAAPRVCLINGLWRDWGDKPTVLRANFMQYNTFVGLVYLKIILIKLFRMQSRSAPLIFNICLKTDEGGRTRSLLSMHNLNNIINPVLIAD